MTATHETSPELDFDLSNLQALGPELIPRLAAIRESEPIFWSEIQKGGSSRVSPT